MTEICKAALEHFGSEHQIMMLLEEMSELQKEICKNYRGANNAPHIAEEIADVQIVLEQMIQLFNCREAVDAWVSLKIERLKGVIDDETHTR